LELYMSTTYFHLPSGCRFRTRCWKADEKCAEEVPPLIERGFDHPSACHYAELPRERVV
jgi:oligopeptide transport system ATP-binding protein